MAEGLTDNGGATTDVTSASVDTGTPAPIDLTNEDALIKVKGSDKPVKFGEHVRGFQSQFTKASQEAARLKRELADRDSRLQQLQQAQQAAQQHPQGQNEDVFAALRALPYLTGQDAVGVVEQIGGQIRQRDQILLAALKRMQAMEQRLGGLYENHINGSFDTKINRWLQEGQYPAEAADLMREVYLAYEGDDLDNEFPGIFKSRWEQLNKAIEASRQAKLRESRKQPFLPGKGGQAGPSKPYELKANSSTKEVADQLWDMLGTSEET